MSIIYIMHNSEHDITVECTDKFKKYWEEREFVVKDIREGYLLEEEFYENNEEA